MKGKNGEKEVEGKLRSTTESVRRDAGGAFPTSSSRGRSASREVSSDSSAAIRIEREVTTTERRKGMRKGTPERPNGRTPQFGVRQETSPDSATEAPKVKRRLDRAYSVPSRSGARAAGRNVKAIELETPVGFMSQSPWGSLTPVLKDMLENTTLDDAARSSLRSLLQKEGFSVHLRNAAGRSDWLQQQANHLATHVRLAEVHADVMKDERNAAAAGCQELHAAGVAVTARAQTELQSAQLHYDELQARARTLNTDLATSEFRRKSADEDVRKLR
jgi:hypothetical protein